MHFLLLHPVYCVLYQIIILKIFLFHRGIILRKKSKEKYIPIAAHTKIKIRNIL
jgi:hypothetical protein